VSFLSALVLLCSLAIAAGASRVPLAPACAGAGAVTAALALAGPRRLRATACGLALCALGVARGGLDAERRRSLDPGPGFAVERALRLRGEVIDSPQATRRGTRVTALVLASDPRLPRGLKVSLWCDSVGGVPRRGSWIEARVQARAPRSLTTPGGFDEGAWLAHRGASLLVRAEGAAWSESRAPPPSIAVYLDRARAAWSERLAGRVPGEAGEFLRGLLLGERSRVTPETVDALRRAGALHLLALSGQHVLLIAALLQGGAALFRMGSRGGAACALLGVWIYSLLTGASPSVIRAAASVTWSAWGRALGRRLSGADGLAWGTALPLFVAPGLATDVGYQLSCLASAGLWAAARARRAWRAGDEVDRSPARPRLVARLEAVVFPIGATAFAQAAVLPLLAARFGAVSVIGLASNLVLVPACDVLLGFGLPLLVVDALTPTPGTLWRVLSLIAASLLRAGERFASWPGSWLPCAMAPAAAVAMTAAASLPWLLALIPRAAAHGAACACAGLWLGLMAAALYPHAPPRTADLRYWLLDVGQGDAQVLEFRDGTTWVVDVGDARDGFDSGRSVVAPFLRARGRYALDLAILTHEDRDHVGGLEGLERDVRIRRLASGRECLEALGRRGVRLPATDTLAAGETLLVRPGHVVARVLWPPPGATGFEPNRRSVVIEIEAASDRLLLTGDADTLSEAAWVPRATAPLAALKLGHHGSHSATRAATLDTLRPRLALISCGVNNRFGHPHGEVLDRLLARHIRAWRTDREGTLALDLGLRAPPRAPAGALPQTPRE
jgi:competence protein ComEC